MRMIMNGVKLSYAIGIMTLKGYGRKLSWANFGTIPDLLAGLGKTM
jgi:hypothetical protein